MTIPKTLPWGAFSVYIDGSIPREGLDYTQTRNQAHNILIVYDHNVHKIEIIVTQVIPEFTSLLIMSLLTIATLLAAKAYKRKHER